jgi:hypothetical protein
MFGLGIITSTYLTESGSCFHFFLRLRQEFDVKWAKMVNNMKKLITQLCCILKVK